MTDDDQLRTLVRSSVDAAEAEVDVESDLAAFRRFLTEPTRVVPMPHRRRPLVPLVAAGTLIVTGVGVAAIIRHQGPHRIATVAESTLATTEDLPTTSQIAPGVPTSQITPVVPTSPPFAFQPPVDGRVTITEQSSLQSATFQQRQVIPFEGNVTRWGHIGVDRFWISDVTTGAVAQFDLTGTMLASTVIPTEIDGRTIHDIVVSPTGTIYGLYREFVGTAANTSVAAYSPTDNKRVAIWTADDIGCADEYCSLHVGANGLDWEDNRVPFVDTTGAEVAGSTLPLDPPFATSWTSPEGAAVPDSVEVKAMTTDTGLSWTLQIAGVQFNDELGTMVHRHGPGSFSTTVQLTGASESGRPQRSALLLMDEARGVALIDQASIPGLLDIAVDKSGAITALIRIGDGVALGRLAPREETPCDIESIRSVLAPDATIADVRCDGPWAVVDFDMDQPGALVVHRVDGIWAAWSPSSISAACTDDLAQRDVPLIVIGALRLTCTTFDNVSAYRPEPDNGDLAAGDEGPRVRALQGELARQGFLTASDVEGSFGEMTRAAVLDYQLATNLPMTANADIDSLRRLGLVAAERRISAPLTVTGSSLGDAPIGQSADEVIAYLTEALGPPDRDERADIAFPTFSNCRNWQPRTLSWSDLTVTIARFDPRTNTPTAEPVLFGFEARSQLVPVRTTAGAKVGENVDDWTAVHPNAEVDLIGPVDWIGPIITLDDGLIGYLDTSNGNRVTSVASSLTPVCDE
jgi:peptidoglycan hydrolase-like protein with peptidoglycan-binding domain